VASGQAAIDIGSCAVVNRLKEGFHTSARPSRRLLPKGSASSATLTAPPHLQRALSTILDTCASDFALYLVLIMMTF